MARGDFRVLSKVWRHSTLRRERKLKIFSSLILSRLLYSLGTACLLKADLRRLDGFQCRCLRQIMNIPAAYVSRVSNESVFSKAGVSAASRVLLQRQLIYLGKPMRAPVGDPLRDVSFIGNTLAPATGQYVRRVGRPRTEWVPTVVYQARQHFGPLDLEAGARDPLYCKTFVKSRT